MGQAAQRHPIDLDAHRGSRYSIQVRDGLVDAKHYKAMGEAIWLYLYLHKTCAQKTGCLKRYRHEAAATELGVGVRTVKRYMDRLRAEGYVIVTRGYNHLSVQITRYDWQAARDQPVQPTQDAPPAGEREVPTTSVLPENDVPDMSLQSEREVPTPSLLPDFEAERSATSDTEKCQNWHEHTLFNTSFNKDDICADAPHHDDTQLRLVCDELGCGQSAVNLKALSNLLARWATKAEQASGQTVLEMAAEARAYHSAPPAGKKAQKHVTVATFGTWLRNAVTWAAERGEGQTSARGRQPTVAEQRRAREVSPGYQRPVRELTPREKASHNRALRPLLNDPGWVLEYCTRPGRPVPELYPEDECEYGADPPPALLAMLRNRRVGLPVGWSAG